MPTKIAELFYKDPGITRDGTPFDATTYVDGKWVRFYKRKPQKMGGYLMLNKGTQQIPRGLFLTQNIASASDTDAYVGYQGYVDPTPNEAVVVYSLNSITNTALPTFVDRTPVTGPQYIQDPLNVWTFATIQGSDTQGALFLRLVSNTAPTGVPEDTVNIVLTIGSQIALPVSVVIEGSATVETTVTPITETVKLTSTGTGIVGTTKNKFSLITSVLIDSVTATSSINNTVTATNLYYSSTSSTNLLNPTSQSLTAGDPNYQGTALILAHVAPTANNPSSAYTGPQGNSIGQIYYGIAQNYLTLSNSGKYTPLVPMMQQGSPFASGRTDFQTADNGICVIGNYIFALCNNGVVRWNTATPYTSTGNPFTITNCVNYWNPYSYFSIGSDNFIYGAPVRVGGEIGGLFWTLTSLVRATRTPIPSTAAPTTIANNTQDPGLYTWTASYVSTVTTCISSRSIASYEPFFFWVGSDCFYQYNGAVSEVQNETNKQWFFNNINRTYIDKVTSFVNVQYHEWWILFPKGNSVENNWALIYNIDYQCWFDTPLNRSSAFRSSQSYHYPVLTSSVPDIYANGNYPLFAHEYGYDAVYGVGQSFSILPTLPTQTLVSGTPLTLNPLLPSQFTAQYLNFTIQFQGIYNDDIIQLQIVGNDFSTTEALTFTRAVSQVNIQQTTVNQYMSIQSITPLINPITTPIWSDTTTPPSQNLLTWNLKLDPYLPVIFVPTPITFSVNFGNPTLDRVVFIITGTYIQGEQTISGPYNFTCTPATSTTPVRFTSIVSIEVWPQGKGSCWIESANPNPFPFTPSINQPYALWGNTSIDQSLSLALPFNSGFTLKKDNVYNLVLRFGVGRGAQRFVNIIYNYGISPLYFKSDITTLTFTYNTQPLQNIVAYNWQGADNPQTYVPPSLKAISKVTSTPTLGAVIQCSSVSIKNQFPIDSYISMVLSQQSNPPYAENPLTLDKINFDMIQTSDMFLTVERLAYPRSKEPYASSVYTFSAEDTFVTLSGEKATIFLLTLESQALGGYFLLGKTIMTYTISDAERPEPY